jgi:uncharacterized phage protein (TIGR02218 family)
VVHKVAAPVNITQAPVLAVYRVIAPLQVSQAPVLVVYKGSPCTTQWCQIWKIERTDGETFRFSSLDRDFIWGGETYQSCDSLVPSASESVSELDAAGNMDLSGAIGPDAITTEDLYSGLFDGAKVQAWLVPWSGSGGIKPLLNGNFGALELTPTGFKVELLGDGAKLMQTPLIQLIQPGCRWKSRRFGGFGGPFCGKDLTALTVTGTIDSATGQREFVDAARAETAGYFTQGKVTFITGANAGISAEIKLHTAGGVFELWPRLPFGLLAGDQYSMDPGCTFLTESSGGTNGCSAWANLVRYGGFDKVPGGDKRGGAANVKAPT